MRNLIFFLLAPMLVFAQIEGKVVKVKDGDTVVVLDQDKRTHTIRVADIDCPEYAQPYSKVAKKFTSDEIYFKEVMVISKGKDRYGRTIGFIRYGEGKDLSRELLKCGYAWHYKKYSKDKSLADIEVEAKERGLGLWQDTAPVPPWEWRRNH
ncbi:Micrococcal nuclease [Flagellimonas maritima]|uniref:Micrococcal nuclease n=1 Tax=Flagellimonas maritima TaxID=1383885 RepID=A0A2Z4LSC4_9FLAO|nr:thermonuclease family protein [Allomuricauda aurantiaca]AWX44795.1 Micrococcal nuclease [Allomuricauda aurantiaca]